jgi:hypothetical protein
MATQNNQLSYQRDIKPLFGEGDRYGMLFAFDLWNYQDVCTHVQAILQRLTDGTMPFDRMDWPAEQIAQFRRWVEAGLPA